MIIPPPTESLPPVTEESAKLPFPFAGVFAPLNAAAAAAAAAARIEENCKPAAAATAAAGLRARLEETEEAEEEDDADEDAEDTDIGTGRCDNGGCGGAICEDECE